MANDTYSAASGQGIYAGRFNPAIPYNALVDSIAAMPDNSWQKLNQNTFQSQWPPFDLRAPYFSGKANSKAVIHSWSGFAYDAVRGRMILWGGGHADTSANEPYIFDTRTGNWQLAFLPSDYVTLGTGSYMPICGGFRQPCSSHTYDNNGYLKVLDKFFTTGGAQHGDGGALRLHDVNNGNAFLRQAGGYTLDLTLAGQGLVGGGTGDNPKTGAYVGVDLPGANAWSVRDWFAVPANVTTYGTALQQVNGTSYYTVEGGKDVMYQVKLSSGAPNLFKTVFTDDNYLNDVVTKVGTFWESVSGMASASVDEDKQVYLFTNFQGTSTKPFSFWDLKTASPSNRNKIILDTGLTGSGAADLLADTDKAVLGIDFHKTLGKFFIWGRGGTLYTLTTPAGNPTPETGWVVEKINHVGSNRPMTTAELGPVSTGNGDRGAAGLFKYAEDLNCMIALQNATDGDVWIFKPAGWQDPRIN